MSTQEVIRTKRLGQSLTKEQIDGFIKGIVNGSVNEAQMAAFAMAVCLQDMTMDEVVSLTQAMCNSGDMLSWASMDVPGPIVDKHSSGGVGDNVSLVLAPVLAAMGLYVPMISGRGLGHTGGTLDKLDAIPGYHSQPSKAVFQRTVSEVGCAIVGATEDIAPADRKLYAVRDITDTVESLPLITASILSKKLASGLDALVLDIKTGSGAFMTDVDSAVALAQQLVDTASAVGLPTEALITDMSQPLASCAGNALEVHNAIAVLKGEKQETRMLEVVRVLAGKLMVLCGHVSCIDDARQRINLALASGAAAERFGRMVAQLGGPTDLIERPEHYLGKAELIVPVKCGLSGRVTRIDTRALGLSVVALGAGREHTNDTIDYTVGLDQILPVGAEVVVGQVLAWVHARDQSSAERAVRMTSLAYEISDRSSGDSSDDDPALVLQTVASRVKEQPGIC